jgi:hypothetical protein
MEEQRGTDRAGRRRKRFLTPQQKYEVWLQPPSVLPGACRNFCSRIPRYVSTAGTMRPGRVRDHAPATDSQTR